jgi:hypothetical protein
MINMQNETTPIVIMKFMDNQYVNSFLEDGLLFMNNVKFFREYEDANVRGDIHEGLAATLRVDNTSVIWGELNINSLVGKIDIRHDTSDKINIYSMTMIRYVDIKEAVNCELKLSDDFTTFGDTCILITGDNISKFFKRLEQAFKKAGIKEWSGKKIQYINRENYHGTMNIFQKFDKYMWQFEWRIGIKQDLDAVYELKLGNLKDIAEVHSTKEMLSHSMKIITDE